MGLIRKSLSITYTLGTVGYRSKSEKVARNIKLTANAARRTNALLEVQNDLIAEQTALIEARTAPVIKTPAPVRPKIAPPEPKVAREPRPPKVKTPKVKVPKPVREPPINMRMIEQAEAIVVEDQFASVASLVNAMDIGVKASNYILTMLELRGIVSAEDQNHERLVRKGRDNEWFFG